MFVSTHGIVSRPTSSAYGPLTTAWIAATGETDTTILGALNTLESDLTTYGLTSKMKALYPMVGGTSTKHSYNFINTAQYQISWNGGGTHSSTGYLPNGTNGYGNTNFDATLLSLNNAHIAVYSRTNSDGLFCDIGYLTASSLSSDETNLFSKYLNNLYPRIHATNSGLSNSVTSAGLMMANRISSTTVKGIRNTTITDLSNTSVTVGTSTNDDIYIGALNNQTIPSPLYYSSREYALASIGEGLTDTEAANFYTAVQTFQTTLGRQVGVPIVSDADAQAFLNAAVITDTTQASAINTLVIGLKTDGLWTKMKAIYPFVGGTSTTHSYNLKNTSQYQLTFNGGWTHSSTGALPNGTNAYANTGFNASTQLTTTSGNIGVYLRNDVGAGNTVDFGASISGNKIYLVPDYNGSAAYASYASEIYYAKATTTGLYSLGRLSTQDSNVKIIRNGSTILYNDNPAGMPLPNGSLYLGAYNNEGTASNFAAREQALAYMSDGLTNAEIANLYSRVQAFQTTLSRNV